MDSFHYVHPAFKLNGFSFSRADLQRVAYAFIKEGDEHEQAIGLFLLHWFDESNTIHLTTSGTTGFPKLIEVSKAAMVRSAKATGAYFDMNENSSALLCLSAQFIAGKMMLVRAMQLGWHLDVCIPTATPLQKNQKTYDFVAMVPMQVANSLPALKQIKTLLIGGAPMSISLRNQLLDLGYNAFESYGMTETITHIAIKSISETYFTAIPGVSFSVTQQNCLQIAAPHLTPELVKTNDVVHLINETQFEFLGRLDNAINSGGIKLFPEVIEQKLAQIVPHRFYICGKSDEKWGEIVVLVIESLPYDLPIEEISNKVLPYEKPKEVYFIPKFQETKTGKIKRILPEL